jgi:hypothetical protein
MWFVRLNQQINRPVERRLGKRWSIMRLGCSRSASARRCHLSLEALGFLRLKKQFALQLPRPMPAKEQLRLSNGQRFRPAMLLDVGQD